MRIPTLVRSLMVGAMVALSLGTVGCGTYFADLLSVSTVRADLASEGRVIWTVTEDDAGNQEAKSTRTDPAIKLTLDANSSPVNYTTAQAEFYYTETHPDFEKPTTNPIGNIPTQFFPFAAQLKTIDRATVPTEKTITLNGLIPIQLVDMTNPTVEGFQRLTAVVATVTLKGTNGFGASITTKVNVPIVISYN